MTDQPNDSDIITEIKFLRDIESQHYEDQHEFECIWGFDFGSFKVKSNI